MVKVAKFERLNNCKDNPMQKLKNKGSTIWIGTDIYNEVQEIAKKAGTTKCTIFSDLVIIGFEEIRTANQKGLDKLLLKLVEIREKRDEIKKKSYS